MVVVVFGGAVCCFWLLVVLAAAVVVVVVIVVRVGRVGLFVGVAVVAVVVDAVFDVSVGVVVVRLSSSFKNYVFILNGHLLQNASYLYVSHQRIS